MDWKFLKKRLHYAWFVCFGCALIFFCTCGLSCNVYSVYLPFITEKFGYTKTQISLFSTVRTVFQMLALLVFGQFYQRLTLRKGMTLAAIINISGYFVYAVAGEYWQFLLGNALVGFGYGLSNMVPVSMILERWFYKDRTMAVSMCSAASGLATIGVPSLITAAVLRHGLSRSFLIEGIVMVALVAVSYLIIQSDPRDKGMHAFGEFGTKLKGPASSAGSSEEPVEEEKIVLSKFDIFLVNVMVIFGGAVCSAGWGNMSMLASTEGFDATTVALSITIAGAMLMVFKFLLGILSEKITLYRASLLYAFLQILGTFGLMFSGRSKLFLFLSFGLFGGAISIITIGLVSWTGDWFPPRKRDSMKRLYQFLYAIGSVGFMTVSGVMADRSGGSYVSSYRILLIFCVFILYVIWRTYRIVRKAEAQKKAGV